MPPAIQNIIEANRVFADMFAASVNFPIAFLAGVLSVLSPCILPVLPAFFANTFKERRAITKMTLIFFAGFAVVFIAFGILAGVLGESLFNLPYRNTLVFIFGFCLLALGVATILGFSLPTILKRRSTFLDSPGIFLTGVFFAFGWSACLGPILAGVLTMSSMLRNWWSAGLLLFFYSLGIFVPIFLLAIFFDKTQWLRRGWLTREIARLKINQRIFSIHPANLLAGFLFILLGSVFMIARGTSFVNYFQMFGGKQLFYDWQRVLINGGAWFGLLGIFLLVIMIVLIIWSWRRSS